jgi:hypothetical protein
MRRTIAEWLAFAVETVVAIAAIGGGVALLVRPDGSLLHMPIGLLARSPFRDFLVPGFLLAGIVGGSAASAAVLVVRRSQTARQAMVVAGGLQMIWAVAQTAFIGVIHPLQLALVSAAFVSLIVGVRLQRPANA